MAFLNSFASMKKLLCALLFGFSATSLSAQPSSGIPRPKLVVGIVIDQMRWDYLYRYYSRYGEDGFKRLMNEGFNCQNTMISYLPSFTAPGHSCIYTGSVPAVHGIAANDWIEEKTGKPMYCTQDDAVAPVGGSRLWGRMSPKNLLVTTVTDELRLATNFHSRVYGIALKDRGAILPAGHLANAAFWFDDSTGNFMTSTHYTNHLPHWVDAFNSKHLADTFLKRNWNLLYPANTYTQSLPDNNPYEGAFRGEAAPVFPHITGGAAGKDYNTLRKIPAGNTMTLQMAKACIEGTELGQRGNTDFLTVSLSSTDYAGHQFAPNSMEVEDMYLRLDRELAAFLRYLDHHIGEGQYTVFLTADHGGAHNASYMQDLQIPAGHSYQGPLQAALLAYVKQQFGKDSLVRALDNYQVCFNEDRVEALKINRAALRAAVCKWMAQQPEVAYVADIENIDAAALPEPVRTMIINGYARGRSGSVQIVPKPGWYGSYGKTGTTHGTWNPYDAHIPLLFYGWGIRHGASYKTYHMTDIAATVAALLHIQMPNGCVGQVIDEAVKQR